MRIRPELVAQPSHGKQSHDPRGDALAFCVLMSVADGWTRVAVVEQGVPAHVVDDLAALMDVPLNFLTRALRIPTTTLRRRRRDFKPLATGGGDRVVGLARLIGCAAVMVQKAGGAGDFDPARWIANWLEKPHRALGGRRPAEFLSTRSGQTLVEDLLGRGKKRGGFVIASDKRLQGAPWRLE